MYVHSLYSLGVSFTSLLFFLRHGSLLTQEINASNYCVVKEGVFVFEVIWTAIKSAAVLKENSQKYCIYFWYCLIFRLDLLVYIYACSLVLFESHYIWTLLNIQAQLYYSCCFPYFLLGTLAPYFCGFCLYPFVYYILNIFSLLLHNPVSFFFFAVSTSTLLMAEKLSSFTSCHFCLSATELAKAGGPYPLTAVRSSSGLSNLWSCMREKEKSPK